MNACTEISPTKSAAPARPQQTPPPQFLRPRANIVANDQGYLLTLDLPGVKRSELELSFENGELTIVGRRPVANPEANVLHRESRVGDYRRVFELDASIDATAISASLEDGVLTVSLPKAERAKPRRIEIAV